MKHIFHLTFALLAGMALCACSSDDPMDNDQAAVPVQPGETGSDDTWSVKIEGDMTRGLSLTSTSTTKTLTPNFNGENIYVYNGDESLGTLKAPSNGVTGDRTLTGSLKNATYTKGQTLTLCFLKTKGFSTYTGQKGTIDDIAANFDYATATATITNVDNNTHTLTISKAIFTSQQAVVEFQFDKALSANDVINITGDNINTASVTLTSAKSANASIYVALPVKNTTAANLTFTITHDSKSDFYKGLSTSKAIANGKYYTSASVNLYKYMKYAISSDKKKIIGSDGYIYDSSTNASNNGTTPAGILAHLSQTYTATQNASGIVLSYKDGPTIDYPSITQTKLNQNQNNKPAGGSAWKLPTLAQWNSILKSLTGDQTGLTDTPNTNYRYVNPGSGCKVLGSESNVSLIYWRDKEGNSSIKCYRGGKNYGCFTGTAQNTTKTGSDYSNIVRPISTF